MFFTNPESMNLRIFSQIFMFHFLRGLQSVNLYYDIKSYISIFDLNKKTSNLRDNDCILDEVSETVFKNHLFMLYGVETS